jgi:hypothetical protein
MPREAWECALALLIALGRACPLQGNALALDLQERDAVKRHTPRVSFPRATLDSGHGSKLGRRAGENISPAHA